MVFRASGRSGILVRQPAKVFVPAAGASPLRQEDHGAGPTKTAGCKQDRSGARGGRCVNVVPDEPEVKAGTLRERMRPGALKIKKSMGFEPVFARGNIGRERDAQLHHLFHGLAHDLANRFHLVAGHVEHQFVVHLQEDLGVEAGLA